MTYPESTGRWATRMTGCSAETMPTSAQKPRAARQWVHLVASAIAIQWRRLCLLARREALNALLASATYDEHWHEHEAQQQTECKVARDWYLSLAASDRFVQQQLRVEIARVEARLWPARTA